MLHFYMLSDYFNYILKFLYIDVSFHFWIGGAWMTGDFGEHYIGSMAYAMWWVSCLYPANAGYFGGLNLNRKNKENINNKTQNEKIKGS
jgi:hypothetical protein